MEIIKKGNIPNDIWYGKCATCKTIFKSSTKELEEISNKQGGDYISDFEYFYLTTCNGCNQDQKSVIFYSKDSRSGLEIYREAIRN